MANTYRGSLDGNSQGIQLTLPVASGVTVTEGDFVYFASGRITSATIAGARIIGQVLQTATGNAGGTVKAIVQANPNGEYLLQNDNVGTTFAASHVGQYFDLTGATGAQLVDTSTASQTTGQLLCLSYNPGIDPVGSNTAYGTFKVAEHAFSPLGS